MVTETEQKPKRKLSGAAAMGPGPGRPKGSKDKLTVDLKRMIEEALDLAGGAQYLYEQSEKSPAAFLTLVGKLLPKDVNLTASVDDKILAALKQIALK